MRVFFSWSGTRSLEIAKVLSSWLVQVVQAIDPWLSEDIEKGKRWSPEIAKNLEESKVGIVCLTPDNLHSDWIMFEAGAISKTRDARVCTFLTDLTQADVEPPLADFEHTRNVEADVKRLVRTINAAVGRVGGKLLAEPTLESVFRTYWPQLAEGLDKVPKPTGRGAKAIRSDRELLEETLDILRRMDRPQPIRMIGGHEGKASADELANLIVAYQRVTGCAEKEPRSGICEKLLADISAEDLTTRSK
jgi:hypothetical protein